jgi:hypothetical protein
MDGAITPYNNPSFIMYLAATLPAFGLCWPDGVDNMRVISIGTGRFRTRLSKTDPRSVNQLDAINHSLKALIDSGGVHQDLACRAIGQCQWGEPINSEVGDLMESAAETVSRKKFLYCRYNHEFTPAEVRNALDSGMQLDAIDNLKSIPFYEKFGDTFSRNNVKLEHLI